MLENLLPCEGCANSLFFAVLLRRLLIFGFISVFEILSSPQKKVLWKQRIGPGQSVSIHTVSLKKTLLLRIILRHCATGGDGILIHKPKNASSENIAERMHRVLEVSLLFVNQLFS